MGGRVTFGKSPAAAGGCAAGPVAGGCPLAGIGSRVLARFGAVARRGTAGWCRVSTARGALRRARATVAPERCADLCSTVRPPTIRTAEGAPMFRIPPRLPGASTNQLHASSIRPDAASAPTTGRAPVRCAEVITGEAKNAASPSTCACRSRLSTIRTTPAPRIPRPSESRSPRFGCASSRKLRKAAGNAARKFSRRLAPYSYRHPPLNRPTCSHRRRRRSAPVLAACDAPAGRLRGA